MQSPEVLQQQSAVSKSPSTSSQSAQLRPKEHGAYAILAIPIVTAIVIAGPTITGVFVAVAAVAGFLAHEPLLVAWGHRGQRAQTATPAANSRLLRYLAITFIAGGVAMAIGTREVRLALVACLAMALVGFGLGVGGQHRSLIGQLWGVTGLSAPCVPILLAGNIAVADAIAIWLTWLLGFTATTFAVHSVIAAQKRKPRGLYFSVLLFVSLTMIAGIVLQVGQIQAILPMVLASWYLFLYPPPAKYLKRVGWSLVATTVVTASLIASLA